MLTTHAPVRIGHVREALAVDAQRAEKTVLDAKSAFNAPRTVETEKFFSVHLPSSPFGG
jgi:hypothetical protein